VAATGELSGRQVTPTISRPAPFGAGKCTPRFQLGGPQRHAGQTSRRRFRRPRRSMPAGASARCADDWPRPVTRGWKCVRAARASSVVPLARPRQRHQLCPQSRARHLHPCGAPYTGPRPKRRAVPRQMKGSQPDHTTAHLCRAAVTIRLSARACARYGVLVDGEEMKGSSRNVRRTVSDRHLPFQSSRSRQSYRVVWRGR
jgi:hypothetical protein